ncbi:MAG: PpiC-type peptidyl-prolyl cis-trans isomerase [Bacteroidetes bacterium OLB10]|nr:MAG: PpiC-type peptidyl-prolyl cis-trans isomerase [Bacteroidetes bacterium OLB10]
MLMTGMFLNAWAQPKNQKNTKAAKTEVAPSEKSAANDPVLVTIAGMPVTKSEFERVYYKNNNKATADDEKSIRDYMELFINYKLKVKEAEALKMDTSKAFTDELIGYRKQLAQPYLTDQNVNDNLIREAYDRLQKDVRASHILIKVSQDTLPKDTLAAYNRIMKIRERLIKGADFAKMARDSSEDPSAKENGGDLGYFTGLQMVYPFETAAYNTKPGQISMPVRTRFGYHLIKVADVRPAVGEIHTAHIMIRVNANDPDSVKNEAKRKIFEIYNKLKSGEKFEDLAKQYSDDKGTAMNGGVLPWFGTGKMVPEFEKAAFALSKDGDYTEPVQTPYGWHIIKRLEKRGIPSFEDKKNEIKNQIMRDSRSELGKASLVARIKNENGFKENIAAKDEFIKSLDSTLANGTFNDSVALKKIKTIFTLGGKNYTTFDFAQFLAKHQTKRTGISSQAIAHSQYEHFVEDVCISHEESQLDRKYPEFHSLMNEYGDGILLFDLTDKMVWSKAVKDTTGLENFYDKNKNNYMWGERLDAVIYTCKNADVASQARKLIKKKKSDSEIAATLNKDSSLNINIKDGKFSKGDNEYIDEIAWVPGLSNDISKNNQVVFVKVNAILAPQAKKLDEARGLITADYQNFLEKTWINELRSKYSFKVNEDVLKTLFQK